MIASCEKTPCLIFFFNDTATTEIYTLSLHDALPICDGRPAPGPGGAQRGPAGGPGRTRSEEHTSELQSRRDLVCRLLLEKKKMICCKRGRGELSSAMIVALGWAGRYVSPTLKQPHSALVHEVHRAPNHP